VITEATLRKFKIKVNLEEGEEIEAVEFRNPKTGTVAERVTSGKRLGQVIVQYSNFAKVPIKKLPQAPTASSI
jgi:hypothetical protein